MIVSFLLFSLRFTSVITHTSYFLCCHVLVTHSLVGIVSQWDQSLVMEPKRSNLSL